jgi:hypothetical protein
MEELMNLLQGGFGYAGQQDFRSPEFAASKGEPEGECRIRVGTKITKGFSNAGGCTTKHAKACRF